MRADIGVGGVFPDYELTDHTGTRRKLCDLQGRDPMILVLSAGGYCPKDRRQAEGLVQRHRPDWQQVKMIAQTWSAKLQVSAPQSARH